jgi:hypothetical protein
MRQSLFPLLRPAYESVPELAEAASAARAESDSAQILRSQVDFDDKVAQELATLRLAEEKARAFESRFTPDGSEPQPSAHSSNPASPHPAQTPSPSKHSVTDDNDQQDEEADEEPPRRAPRKTILFAVGVGLVATICMVVFLISDHLNSFEGAERIGELLESANTLTGDEFDAVETRAGDLQDWFFLKHGLEHYAIPKQFANIKTVGCRVFKFEGVTVAQIMAVTDKELLLYVFPAGDLGVKIRKGRWEIIEEDSWAGAVTGIDGNCFLVAFKGTKDEMKEFLSKTAQ